MMAVGACALALALSAGLAIRNLESDTGLDASIFLLLRDAYFVDEHYVEPVNTPKTKQRLLAVLIAPLDTPCRLDASG